METVLLVCGGAKNSAAVTAQLSPTEFASPQVVPTGVQAREALQKTPFSVVLVVSPLPDESGAELAVTAAGTTTSGVILLVAHEKADAVCARVSADGVLVLERPLNPATLRQTMQFALAAHYRMASLKRDNSRLQDKLEEMKWVDRAKCVLIQYLKLTEPQAHRYIEKQAMDCRLSRREVAENILKAYEP